MTTTTNTKPSLPWKTRIAISVISKVTDTSRRSNGTINRRLLNFLNFKSPPNPNPIHEVSSSDVTVDPTRNLWFRLFTPTPTPTVAGGVHGDTSSSMKIPVLIFFHGGGFSYLSPDSKAYDFVCRRFARKLPAYVISVNYRLAPEFRYPSQYDDGFDVLKFLEENSVLPENADLSKCFLGGDSAGANLAHHVAVRACRAEFRVIKVVGLILIQPFFGGEERTESETRLVGSFLVSVPRTDWCWKSFLPEGADRDHEAANVCGPNGVDISGLDFPDAVVFVGGFDPLQDWQRRYYEWLKKSGKEAELIEYPNMIHAFYIFPELPESSQLFTQVKDFVHKIVSKL